MTPEARYKARVRAEGVKVTPDLMPRFMSKVLVDPSTGCWLWQGGIGHGGYGNFSIRSIRLLAHRVSFELFVRALQPGEHIDHKCDTPACVNPADLDAVTLAENNRRKGLTMSVCGRGHERVPDNLYITPQGSKACRKCRALAYDRHRKKVGSHYAQ